MTAPSEENATFAFVAVTTAAGSTVTLTVAPATPSARTVEEIVGFASASVG